MQVSDIQHKKRNEKEENWDVVKIVTRNLFSDSFDMIQHPVRAIREYTMVIKIFKQPVWRNCWNSRYDEPNQICDDVEKM
jgi:selenophosphate synthase